MVTTTPTPISLDLATDADHAAWDQFVSAHPRASGYHLWAWRAVFERAFAHETAYIVARSGTAWSAITAGSLPHGTWSIRRVAAICNYAEVGGGEATASSARPPLTGRRRRLACGTVPHDSPFQIRRRNSTSVCTAATGHRRSRPGSRSQPGSKAEEKFTVQSGGAELLDSFYDVFARKYVTTPATPVFSEVFASSVGPVFLVQLQSATTPPDHVSYASGSRCPGHRRSKSTAVCGNVLLPFATQYAIEQRGIFDFGRPPS